MTEPEPRIRQCPRGIHADKSATLTRMCRNFAEIRRSCVVIVSSDCRSCVAVVSDSARNPGGHARNRSTRQER